MYNFSIVRLIKFVASQFSHLPFSQASLTLGMQHEVVCDVARRLSDLAIQNKNYDRVRGLMTFFACIHKYDSHFSQFLNYSVQAFF
jgi:riboflavin transporter FmnP